MKRFFRKGDSGQQVQAIQQRLKTLVSPPIKIDGIFGLITATFVTTFQLKSDLNADGVVGPTTWKALDLEPLGFPIAVMTPKGVAQLYEIFGNPLEPGYWKEYGGFCETPIELNHVFTYRWKNKNGFWCNKLLIPIFQHIYYSIVNDGLAKELQSFDGCFNIRYVRGMKKLSTHSWGIAVDHNASTNRLGAQPTIHPEIVQIFEANGFTWGGRFTRVDAMHFQYCRNY